jgi:hypothetical protein
MKYYTTTTEFNCGIDLHARQTGVILSAVSVSVRQRSSALLLELSARADAPEGIFSAADTLSVGRRRLGETVFPQGRLRQTCRGDAIHYSCFSDDQLEFLPVRQPAPPTRERAGLGLASVFLQFKQPQQ